MSSQPSFAAEQLLELLLQLKKTTPAAARQILNGQPQIAYALMTLMVTMGAVNFEVFQKTLADYGSATRPAPPSLPPSVSSTPVPALPPHLQAQTQYRTTTPPSAATPPAPSSSSYAYANGQGPPQPQPQPHTQTPPNANYGQQPSQPYGYNNNQPHGYPNYSAPYGGPAAAPPSAIPDTLASIPEEQKALILRVLSMTSEQINALPPTERATFIQLRATLGVPVT